jgi:hypothetical protein
MTYEDIFKRTVDRLIGLPGYVQMGRTSDTRDRYITWYPHENEIAHIRFILAGSGVTDEEKEIVIDSNLTSPEDLIF